MRTSAVIWVIFTIGGCLVARTIASGSGFRAIFTGATGLVCSTAVESVDLGCLLRWDCPRANVNTTYTVQTKTQGDPWQDVPWCVWVSSHSCSVSQAFSDFQLYYMLRLAVHPDPSSTVWMKPLKFDYSDFTFSPPSISVSVREERLLVMVQFPCAANRRCSSELCCPISRLIDPWTTVTVTSGGNLSALQSRTVWTQDVVSYVEFSGLSPGQNYCAVANFSFPTFALAASPKSAPQCILTAVQSELQSWLLLGTGWTFLLLFVFLAAFVLKLRANTPGSRAAPVPVSAPPPLVPVDLQDIHLELTDAHHQVVL